MYCEVGSEGSNAQAGPLRSSAHSETSFHPNRQKSCIHRTMGISAGAVIV